MIPEKILIATPTASGIVTVAYVHTIVAITTVLKNRNIRCRYMNFDGSDVVMARNYLSNIFIQDKECSHILFVDSDMAVPPETIAIMAESRKEFIGAICPGRELDLDRYGSYRMKGESHLAALAMSLKYKVKYSDPVVSVERGLCRVNSLGFGCVLIAKSLFEKMIATNGVAKLVSHKLRELGLIGEIFDFFSEIARQDGDYLSEDYSFCERVNRVPGGEIWAVVGGAVGHVGHFEFKAPYSEKLKAGG